VNRPRILFVLWRLFRGGGVPIVTRAFLRHFDRSSFDVHVCTVRPIHTEDAPASLGDGITYHALGISGQPSAGLRLRAMRGIREVVRRVQPDILHLHSGTASYAALAAAGRHRGVLEVHDAPQAGRMSPVNRRFERILVKRLGFTPMVHSRAVLEATADAWRIEPRRFRLVPLGVDTEAFAPDPDRRVPTRAALGVPADAPVVSYVARIVPEKRPELFLAAARHVLDARPDVWFLLVGQGAGVESAREEAMRLGLGERLLMPGFVEHLPDVYHASDVFLSTSRYEGFGLAIAEAMAAGVPVVSTLVGGVADVVGDAGILEPSSDAAVLAGHVLALLNDGRRRLALAEASRRRMRDHLDVRLSVRGFEAVYRRVLGSGAVLEVPD